MGLKKFFKGLFKSSSNKETSAKPVAATPVKKSSVAAAAAATSSASAPKTGEQQEQPVKVEHTVEEVQDIAEIDEIKDESNVQVIPEEAVPGTTEAAAAAAAAAATDAAPVEDDLDTYDFEEVHTHEAEEIEKTYKDVSDVASTRIGRDDPFTFGQRKLENEDDVWNHNAWDNVELTEDQIKELEVKIDAQKEHPVKDFDKKLVNENPAKYWDLFYKNNKENFFKDRKWLQIEFPSLYEATKADAGEKLIFEIGCGAGNTMFPILNQNENPKLRIHGSDFSPRAVELVKTSESFDAKHASASVWDLANAEGALPEGIEENSVDIAIMIFVFSALSPNEWDNALNNLAKILKPGGKILFRDYGRYDLAQVRFKKHRILEDNFYIRGDNTRVYFFTEEELREIFTKKFVEDRIGMDRRLIVNRKRQVKMYRCWLQAVFDVPTLEQATEEAAAAPAATAEEVPAVEAAAEEEKTEEVPVVEAEPVVEETPAVEEAQIEAEPAVEEETPAVETESEPIVEEQSSAVAPAVTEEPAVATEEPTVVEEATPAATEETTEEPVTEEATEEATEEESKESTPVPASAGSKKSSSNKKKNNKKKKKKGKK